MAQLVWRVYPPVGSIVETKQDPRDGNRMMVECWQDASPVDSVVNLAGIRMGGELMYQIRYQLQNMLLRFYLLLRNSSHEEIQQ